MDLHPDINKMPPPNYAEAVGGVYATTPIGFYAPNLPNTQKRPETSEPPIMTSFVPLGPNPTRMICPLCNSPISTITKAKPGIVAYLSGAIIALFGCVFGCCLIPCCIQDCMDMHHTCPECKSYLGRFRRI